MANRPAKVKTEIIEHKKKKKKKITMLDSRKEWENTKSQKDYNAASICIKLSLLTQAYAKCKTRMFKHIAEQGRYIPLNRTFS
jgi:hypothetical protein